MGTTFALIGSTEELVAQIRNSILATHAAAIKINPWPGGREFRPIYDAWCTPEICESVRGDYRQGAALVYLARDHDFHLQMGWRAYSWRTFGFYQEEVPAGFPPSGTYCHPALVLTAYHLRGVKPDRRDVDMEHGELSSESPETQG